jgi:hypothetical protein
MTPCVKVRGATGPPFQFSGMNAVLWDHDLNNFNFYCALDHLASKFELFRLSGFLKRFSKTFPIETDVEMFYPIVAPHNPAGTVDSTLYQEALVYILDFMVLWFMRRTYLNDPTLFLHFCDYLPLKRTWAFI